MKLLAIPNDSMDSYFRTYEEDFLSEFNPLGNNGKRFFDEVIFLNWKDDKKSEYFNVESFPFLKDKSEARRVMSELISDFDESKSSCFKDIFLKEFDDASEIINNYNPGLVRAFNTHFAGELGSLIKSKYKIPLVISVHDPSRLTSIIESADSLICISEDLKNKCLEKYSIGEDKIKVIPDGVDMDFFYPRKNNFIEFQGKYKILSVGRIVPSKNIENLLKSLVYVKEELGEDISHLHLGKGGQSDLNKLIELREDLGLSKITSFLGGKHKTELPFYYSWADVYSLPTLWEGLGRAQIESLACGTPVLTTNYAPMSEIVEEGYNGLTYNPNDPKDIAMKTIDYFKNEALRSELEKNARNSVKDKYDIRRVMQMNCENYQELLGKA
jgi:glycosyltransferase involved in cell wall biosynthesis